MNQAPRANLEVQLRTLAIIVAAMVMGLLMAVIVLLVVRAQQGAPLWVVDRLGVISIVAAAFAAAQFALSLFVPGQFVRQTLARGAPSDETAWGTLYLTRGIVGGALLEGAGFFNAIAFLLEGSPVCLLLAVLLAVLLLALYFPSRARFDTWRAGLEQQARDSRQMNSLRGK